MTRRRGPAPLLTRHRGDWSGHSVQATPFPGSQQTFHAVDRRGPVHSSHGEASVLRASQYHRAGDVVAGINDQLAVLERAIFQRDDGLARPWVYPTDAHEIDSDALEDDRLRAGV